MDEQLYEGGWVKDTMALIGWPAMVCVRRRVSLVGSRRSSIRVVLHILSSPSCRISLPLLLSPQSLLLLLPVSTKSCRHTFAILHHKASQHQNEGQNRQHGDCTQTACTAVTSQCLPHLSTLTESIPRIHKMQRVRTIKRHQEAR